MFNYLKKTIFSLLILMMPYMNSASNAMDAETNDESRSTLTYRRVVNDDQKDALSSVNQSTSLKEVSEDESWTSYVSSSLVKGTYNVVKVPYDVMVFAIQKPKVALPLILCYLTSAAAAGCACYCGITPQFFAGCQSDSPSCASYCKSISRPNPQCFPGDKGC